MFNKRGDYLTEYYYEVRINILIIRKDQHFNIIIKITIEK